MELDPILKSTLSLESDVPFYSQLNGIIKHGITSGLLKPGQLLPSESELCGHFGVSRNTVRQAIGALEEDGFVVRKRGKGTFVTDPNLRRKSVPYSFTTEISGMGRTPSSALVDFSVTAPPETVKNVMQLDDSARVYRFTRIRKVDGAPLILETSYYPQYIYPNLTREMLETHSIYSLLYHVGITPVSASDTYEAVLLEKREAELLNCPEGSPGFQHKRRTTNENGNVYEYTTSYMPASSFRLDVHFQKGAVSFSRTIK